MIVVIDNYDSFTYNLVQYIGEYRSDILVVRHDEVSMADLKNQSMDRLVISPGPGRPADAGISMDAIRYFYDKVPILGVCLGHQAIGEVFGGTITYADTIMHGKVSQIFHEGTGIYHDIPSPFNATRYHSLVIDPQGFPHDHLDITARTNNGTIMGVRHKQYPVVGIQYHPESILTENGPSLIRNFLNIA